MLDISQRAVTQLQNLAIDPLPIKHKGKRGTKHSYDIRDVHQWQIRRQTSQGNILNYTHERAGLTKALREEKEFQVEMLKGKLITRERHIEELSVVIARCKAKLIALPSKIAQIASNAGELIDIEDGADKLIREALYELSKKES
ncbi:MAG: hypothetical protein AAF434_07090 [Pseudomonadota bacterium]